MGGLNRTIPALLLVVVLVAPCRPAGAESPRVTDGLQVLYTFETDGRDVVRDRSGVEPPVDLRVEVKSGAQVSAGRLVVSGSSRIGSTGPAGRLAVAIRRSGELTLEAWLKSANDRQAGPARIVSLSDDPSRRNVTLGQEGRRFDVRLRTTRTGENGLPSLATPELTPSTDLSHVVYLREKSGRARIFVDGKAVASAEVEGDLSTWSDSFRLFLANERTGDRPWLGELHLVAIYDRALTEQEVARNHAAGVKSRIDVAALLPPPVDRRVDFVKDVQPILRARCFECHATGNEEGGLNLGTRARVMEGGDHGPVLVQGRSAESKLVHLVAAIDESAVMPPEGERLDREQIGILRAWIDQGAEWPASADVLDPRTERAREHWAFQPLRTPDVPAVLDESWARSPIDGFVLAKLESEALAPSPPLDARRLIRRVTYDLVGLPPTPEEIERFVVDAEADADAALGSLVDRLLATRHYGERWSRHWLDVARYADSAGQEGDQDRPNAYHYRDFVIRAFEEDLPFDTFVRWQLAGDEYEPGNPRAVAATGFLVAGPNTMLEDTFLEEERLRNRYNELDDVLATMGSGLLGLTIGCARCHDHKYDAISAREYHRLLAAFHGGDRAEVDVSGVEGKVLAFRETSAEPVPTWLFERADFYDRDQPVRLGFPAALSRGATAEEYWDAARNERPLANSSYQRKALAEWIVDVDRGAGPLLARVIVNRVWQHHFGEGLVRTVSDFGVRGDAPTHPELLEWLAHDFVAHGWKLKRLHRLIVTSAAYRQDSAIDPAKAKVDPANQLLWRRTPQRLEAEILRDAMLAVAGTLNLEAYGPGFKPPIADEAMVARNLKTAYPNDAKDEPATRRRSVYMFQKRVVPYPLLAAFDRPDALQSCGRRDTTTVAPQALALLNGEFVRTRAGEFADRLLGSAEGGDAALVERAFSLALGRPPSDGERDDCVAFVASQTEHRTQREAKPVDARREAVADFCQALFGSNEFVYVD